MEPVRTVGQVFFPLDEELALLPGSLTPKQQEHLAHLGSWMPFERAAQMLDTMLGVHVSEPTVRRGTERAGALYESHQTAQGQQSGAPSPLALTGCEQQVISIDGAYVPLVAGAWAEVRTVAIGEVKQESKAGADEVHTCHLSYSSRMTDAESFADVAEVEMHRRAVSQAKAVAAVTDGAPWIQRFIDLHRNDAVRILDFPHAAEHVSLLAEALEQAKVPLPAQAVQRSLHVLKHRGPGLLLRWCEQVPDALTSLEAVHKHLEYFRKRIAMCSIPTTDGKDGRLVRRWWKVPTKWSCKHALKGQACTGSRSMSIRCLPCGRRSVVSAGRKPGKRPRTHPLLSKRRNAAIW